MYGLIEIRKYVQFFILRQNSDFLDFFLYNEPLHVEEANTIDGTLRFIARVKC